MSDETRAKFLAAIAAKVGADRVEEAHVFPPIKQGGTENGVAVVAVRATELADPAVTPPHGDPLGDKIVEGTPEPSPAARDDNERAAPDDDEAADGQDAESFPESEPPAPAARLTVYTAKYRLTVKGPERGKWEFAMQAEADAPLVTVDAVVRGVQRRSGDVDDPERLSGDEFAAALRSASPEARG